MTAQQENLYRRAEAQFAPAIARLAHAMERQPDRTADLMQDIHFELWRSFGRFEEPGEIGWLKALVGIAPSAIFVAVIFGGIRWVNHRAARKIGAERHPDILDFSSI